jgi:hypothetical protein
LFDTGASRSFIDLAFAKQHGIALPSVTNVKVILGTGSMAQASACSGPLVLYIGGPQTIANLIGLQLSTSFDIILGQDFLSKHGAVLDTASGNVSFAGREFSVTGVQGGCTKDRSELETHPQNARLVGMDSSLVYEVWQ